MAYANLGDTRRAILYFEQELAIAREIGDRNVEGRVSWGLGLAYEKLGKLPLAIERMQVQVDYEREIGHPDAERHEAYMEAVRARPTSV